MTDVTLLTLRDVRDRLADPQRWTQHAAAADASGRRVGIHDADAACWCLTAATILDAPAASSGTDARLWLNRAVVDLHDEYLSLAAFNDAPDRAHAEILAVVDRAAELVRSETP